MCSLYLPNREIDADVGGDDWTRMRSRMKKLENRLIPVKKNDDHDVMSY